MQLLIYKKAFLKHRKRGLGKTIFGSGNEANVSIAERDSSGNYDGLLGV